VAENNRSCDCELWTVVMRTSQNIERTTYTFKRMPTSLRNSQYFQRNFRSTFEYMVETTFGSLEKPAKLLSHSSVRHFTTQSLGNSARDTNKPAIVKLVEPSVSPLGEVRRRVLFDDPFSPHARKKDRHNIHILAKYYTSFDSDRK
jgi:hypothetical protein